MTAEDVDDILAAPTEDERRALMIAGTREARDACLHFANKPGIFCTRKRALLDHADKLTATLAEMGAL